MYLSRAITDKLDVALGASGFTSGATHNFYHYPARFSPDIARAVIESFSSPGDIVLDPFMGGGTTIIEGLLAGRRMVGNDLNALAHFVTDVRTTPLSDFDEQVLVSWAHTAAATSLTADLELPEIANLPRAGEAFLAKALATCDRLPHRRQQRFARCALLRLGQLMFDCRDFESVRRRQLAAKLPELVAEMLLGLHDFVDVCRNAGFQKQTITGNRLLLNGNAIGIDGRDDVLGFGRPRLVFTSPPYPSVHVLYHRWQYRGRKETAAPYWIANVPDGQYESFYTGGSRTPTGQNNYFAMVTGAFDSVRKLIDPKGLVVQLIGFSDTKTQLPRYLAAMERAGLTECFPSNIKLRRLVRRVPNRKWYARLQQTSDAASEILLVHRVRKHRA